MANLPYDPFDAIATDGYYFGDGLAGAVDALSTVEYVEIEVITLSKSGRRNKRRYRNIEAERFQEERQRILAQLRQEDEEILAVIVTAMEYIDG